MRRLQIFIVSLVALLNMTTFIMPTIAYAASCSNSSSAFLGLPTWYKYLTVSPDSGGGCSVQLPKDADGKIDFAQSAGRIGLAAIEILLRIAAMVSVGFIIYGGYRYILSQGEPDNVKKAQGTILSAVIGLVITIFATAIVNLLGGVLL